MRYQLRQSSVFLQNLFYRTSPALSRESLFWKSLTAVRLFGAGNEIRTRYLHLGKVALCQMSYARVWRRHPDLNRGIADLQSTALPLGYGAKKVGAWGRNRTNDTRIFSPLLYQLSYPGTLGGKWSGQRDSNSLPPPWQGGALPNELCPHMATEKGLEPSTSGVTGRRSNRLNYSAREMVGATGLEPVTPCL